MAISPLYAAQEGFASKVELLAQKLTSSTKGEVLGVEGDLVYINLGEKDFIREGTVFEVVRLGEAIVRDKETYRKERPIGDIEVTRVRKNMSYAKARSTYAQIKAGDRVYQKRKRMTRVALTEFPYRNGYNDLTKNLYEHLTIYFAQKGLQVVERSKLNNVLQEQKISYSGVMDISTAQKLGKLVGAQAVLVGSISDLRDDVSLNARLVDVETGTFLTAALVKLQKTPAVKSMLEKGQRTAKTSKWTLSKSDSSGSGQKTNIQNQLEGEKKNVDVVEQNGFLFKPVTCGRKRNKLTCAIHFINNIDEDKKLKIWRNHYDNETYIYDNFGNQYIPNMIRIGPKKTDSRDIEQVFIPNIPIKVSFDVDEFNQEATYITLAICIEGFEQLVVINNIPINSK
jgi:TolB-like protein